MRSRCGRGQIWILVALIFLQLVGGSDAVADSQRNRNLGRSALDAERYQEAIDLLTEVVACLNLDPRVRADATIDRAKAHVALRHFSDAADDFQTAAGLYRQLDMAATVTDARIALGGVLLAQDDAAGALAVFSNILDGDQRNLSAIVGLGRAYVQMGKPEQAIDTFDRVQITNRTDGSVYLHRGEARAALGRERLAAGRSFAAAELFDAALRDLDHAAALAPKNALLHIAKGRLFASNGDTDAAMDEFDRALDSDNITVQYEAFLARADLRFRTGDVSRSLADLEAAIGIDPAAPRAYTNRGLVHIAQGDVEPGIADLTVAVERSNGAAQVDALLHRGSVFLQTGDSTNALTDFSAARELDGDNPDVLLQIGNVYLAANNKTAIDMFDLALDIDPDHAVVLNARGSTRIRLGIRIAMFCDLLRSDGQLNDEEYDDCRQRAQSDYDLATEDFARIAESDNAADLMKASAMYGRAVVHTLSGRFNEAAVDFAAARALEDIDLQPRAMIWEYLTAGRADEEAARAVLTALYQTRDPDTSAGGNRIYDLIIRLYTDDLSASRYSIVVGTLAKEDDALRAKGDYYLGQYFLLRDRNRRAVTQFESVIDSEKQDLFEYQMSVLELGRLREG